MAEDKNDIVLDSMPGADVKTEEETKSFEVDLNFGDETPTEDVVEDASEEEEVEFPSEEVVEEDEITSELEEEEDAEDIEDPEDQDEVEVPGELEEELEEETADLIEEDEVEQPQVPERSPMVPKSRLDEVLAKNKKMQKQLDEMQQKETEAQAEAPKYDFDIKEQEYQQLILDGESTKAVQLRNEIRAAEKDQMMFEVQQQMGQTVQQSQAAQELQTKAAEIEETFSILNENHEAFDKDLATEVMELRDAFIVQGYEPADSLAKATEYTLAAKHPELLQGSDEVAAVQTNEQNKAVVEKRKKTTVKKKLEASKSQPPKLKGESTAKRKSVADINVLSDDEFGALPDDTLKRMRGDFG